MKFIIRLAQRTVIFSVGVTVIWLIATQVFGRLDQKLPLLLAILVTYVVSAYVILPKVVHLTILILRKGRIPRFTRASDGLCVDPVNIILLGTKKQLDAAFQKIQWYKADRLTTKSRIKMVQTFLANKPYYTAPFSSLFLFGRPQDIGFQKPVGHSPRQRHHVRFWVTNPDQIINPLDTKFWFKKQKVDYAKTTVWLGAGSKDVGFGFSRLTYQISHRIDHNVDEERRYILVALSKAKCIGQIAYYKPGAFKIGKYTSDGKIAVAKLL